jgi:hypothetical protein
MTLLPVTVKKSYIGAAKTDGASSIATTKAGAAPRRQIAPFRISKIEFLK